MTTLDEFVSNFEILDNWEQRYQYLIELGEELPEMPQELMISDNQVKGCMSTVYVSPYHGADNSDLIYFYGYCDTSIIRGVLSVLIELVNGKTAEEIQQLDIDEIFERLQLHKHLSPNRHVGIYAIVTLMKELVDKTPDANPNTTTLSEKTTAAI
jgi:cysteine desulfuration protein SufE